MKVTIHAAKTTLSHLIARAHAGEEVVIARAGVPVARLVPIIGQVPVRQSGTLRGLVRVPAAFFDRLPPDPETVNSPDFSARARGIWGKKPRGKRLSAIVSEARGKS